MVVFGVGFEVGCEFVDTSGQQSHLDFWTAGVACATRVGFYDFSFNAGCDHFDFPKK
jgi:hypothetical protein